MQRDQAFFNLDLEGLERLEKKLNELPIRIRNKALRKALDKGSEVVLEEAIRLCPKRKPTVGWMAFLEDDNESLHDNIKKQVSVTRRYAWARVGVDYKKVRHGHLVEFGVSPHMIRIANRIFRHPGTRRQPFMRPAFDTKGEKAVEIMSNILYDVAMEGFKHGR